MSAHQQAGLDIPPPTLVFDENAGGILLDLETLLSSRLLIQGSSRSGKSHLLRYIAEGLAKRIPVILVDWEGEYRTLKEAFPCLWLGDVAEGADVPLRPHNARRLCRELVGAGASVVVDLSELEVEARYETAAAFLDELMHLPRGDRRARLVALDECHELAPQGGDVPSSKAVRAIVSRGGKRGLCTVAVTQRLSRLDKSVAEAMNWIVGRTVLDVDVRRAADQLGFDKRQAAELKGLKRGRFFAMGPAIGDGSVQMIRSGDVVSHHPDGARLGDLPPTATEIAARLDALRANPDEVDLDAAGRQELLEEIERLKELLAQARAGNTSDPEDIKRAVAAAKSPLEETIKNLRATVTTMAAHAQLVIAAAGIPLHTTAPPEEADEETREKADDERRGPAGPGGELHPEVPARSGTARDRLPVATEARTRGATQGHDRNRKADVRGEIESGDWAATSRLIEKGAHPKAVEMVAYLVRQARAGTPQVTSDQLAEATGQQPSSAFRDHRKAIIDCGYAEYVRVGDPDYLGRGYIRATQDAIDHEPPEEATG
ncbi:MAG: helicase HerA domain-containing protein [Fimbriimonas sp.]